MNIALGDPRLNTGPGIRAWNLGLGATSTPGATTYPLNAPPVITGTPLPGSVGGLAAPPAAASPPTAPVGVLGAAGAPAAGGGGSDLAGTLIAAGLGFLGGYRRQPAMTVAGVRMGQAMEERKMIEQAQATAESKARAMAETNVLDPESLDRTAQNLMNQGFVEEAFEAKAQARKLREFARQDDTDILRASMPVVQAGLQKKQAYQSVKKTVEKAGGVKNLNPVDRLGITTQFVYSEMPYAASDAEYARAAQAGDVIGVLSAVKRWLGLGPTATPDDTIRAMMNRMQDSGEATDDFLKYLDEWTPSISLKGLRRETPAAGVTRPVGLGSIGQTITGSTFGGLGQ